MASDSDMLQCALQIAHNGWPVFPCKPDKSPYVKSGFKAATREADQIRAWWTQFPDAMIGVPTGMASGVFVIDLDKRPDADGVEAWRRLCAGRELPETGVALTPSGGQHIYFAMPESRLVRNSASSLGTRIDVRGEGGYVIVPPSHCEAGQYNWKLAPVDACLAPAPDWLLDLLDADSAAPSATLMRANSSAIDLGRKTASHADIAAALATIPNSDLDWERWNNTGLATYAASEGGAFDLFDRWSAKSSKYNAAITRERWEHYGTSPPTRCGAGTLFHQARQADPAWRAPSWGPAIASARFTGSGGGDGRDTPMEKSEDAFAVSFARAHEAELKFDHTRGAWYRWAGDCWTLDENDYAFHCVRAHLRKLARLNPETKSLGRIRVAREVDRAARADRRLAVDHKAWNRDPWLLGVKGGVIDLRTGEMMPPDPAMMINQQTSVAPADRGTPHPLWDQFLAEITADDVELQQYLWRLAGLCLTGDTSEEALFFVYGPGGNGKGTWLRAIAEICGDYARAAAATTFMASHNDRHLTELARLKGARLVTASETEEGRSWALARLKELTGNERPITANFMRRDHFEFMPTFKIIIVGNTKPKIETVDEAIRRRLHVIPFTQMPARPDPTLKERLKAEYPAILRSMIDGCLKWQSDRLGRPRQVERETRQYLSEEDIVEQWRQECCDEDSVACISIAKLYGSFQRWCERNQEAEFSKRRFTAALRRRGCKDGHDAHANRALKGLRLKREEAIEMG